MIVVGDTSGIIAALNRSDPEQLAAKAALDAAGQLAISPLTVTEIHQVATSRAGRRTADRLVAVLMERCAEKRAELTATTPGMIQAALQLRNHYEDLDLDLVDAVNVVLAAKKHTDCVLTLDRRDFRAVRPLTAHPAFRLLPDDM